MYPILKSIHMSFAMLSILGFIVRGIWMLQGSTLLQKKIVKVLPHIIDTLFLLSGFGVVFSLDFGLFEQAWLQTKIALLFLYIGLGTMAFKSKTKANRVIGFVGAILTFAYIIGVAANKTALSWFA